MRIAVGAAALVVLVACSGSSGDPVDRPGKGCAAIVHVFVQTDASSQRERRIGQVIDGAEGVLAWSFHSSREAYREFKRTYRDEPDIYESKGPSDFPSRFEVTLASAGSYDLFERTLMGATTGVDQLVPGGCATETPSP